MHIICSVASFPPSCADSEVSAVVSLDNKEVDSTKWSQKSNRAWEHQLKLDLHQASHQLWPI